MPEREPRETKNLDRYGYAPLPWSRPRDILAGSVPGPEVAMYLSTTRPDGRPHTAGIGALWHDGDLYFTSNPNTRKSRNLAANPAGTIAMRLPGIDMVFEGEAARTTDAATLQAVAALFREGGWPAAVEGDAITAPYSAPSAGPPPWHLYRFVYHTAFGVATEEPHGATRWRFKRA
jgi:hypothetical protein